MENKPKVILWSTAYADLVSGKSIGGIGVQMMFWAKAFCRNGWRVVSLYNSETKPDYTSNDIEFKNDLQTHSWNFFIYLFFALKLLLTTKPDLVICRGGRNRNLLFIAISCKLLRIKLVQFLGSDADLSKNYSNFPYSVKLNIRLFRMGLRFTQYFVVQNDVQKKLLSNQFKNKHILMCPNIWELEESKCKVSQRDVVLWVGNTRKLKRPEWVFEIAKYFPQEQFVIIGGNADQEVYDRCKKLAEEISNVSFLGAQPFHETNKWFEKAKILLCTSEYEGFPNTFLQAWANEVPVLSTVNPSNTISSKGLGIICDNIESFRNGLEKMLNPSIYSQTRDNIHEYFESAHSLKANYNNLMRFIEEN